MSRPVDASARPCVDGPAHDIAAAAALDRATGHHASHAAYRTVHTRRVRSTTVDGVPHESEDVTEVGASVRVRVDGSEGVAWTDDPTPAAAARATDLAVALARAAAVLGRGPDPVAEPVHGEVTWHDGHRIDPCSTTEAERVDLLRRWSTPLLQASPVQQVVATVIGAWEERRYTDLAGTTVGQTRARMHPFVVIAGTDPRTGVSRSLRSLGPPTGRGWEYVLGEGWDWEAEFAELPGHLADKLAAPAVRPGRLDLVIAPSHLWMPLHETVGHATELDRALGHEASYAGTTFVGPDDVGTFRYGSPHMTVTADRTAPHGLATVGWDDEGVRTGSWTLVDRGVLAGFQHDRDTASAVGAHRSRGCAHAESARHRPLSRMPNVSLLPAAGGPGTEDLIGEVTDGVYLEGGDAFSVDDRRRSFQFSAQRAHRISGGRLAGQVAGMAYRSSTVAFWSRLAAVGGAATVGTFGADMCGKGQPLQIAGSSHSAPVTLFRGIPVVAVGGAGS